MTDETNPAPASKPVAAEEPIKVSIKISGTLKSGFRFNCGGVQHHQLTHTQHLSQDQARRLGEFYVALINEKKE